YKGDTWIRAGQLRIIPTLTGPLRGEFFSERWTKAIFRWKTGLNNISNLATCPELAPQYFCVEC
ncbi:MAG: hypothetical protein KBA60_12155, partial [Flavobacteriales bacterium]|nr:hypothetical protein [Flavobacteriales bacterium]